MTNLCNVNGEIVAEEDARVSILDRGFLFGDSVYEVTRTRDGVLFAWPEHLQRLHDSADGLEMELGIEDRELTRRVLATVEAAGNDESYVRVIITRGRGTAPFIDVHYAPGPPTCIVMARDLPRSDDRPARVAIVPRLRNDRRALDPAIKSGNYLNNVMGLKEARSRGATDCLFMNRDGKLTEASTANAWIVTGDSLATPALSAGLLAGITRRLLLQVCRDEGIPCEEKDLYEPDVRAADGMFLTSSLRDITEVSELDGEPMPRSPMIARLQARFAERCRERIETVDRPAIARLLE